MNKVAAGLCLLFLLVLSSCTRTVSSGLNPGDLAPDFKLRDIQGVTRTLADYRGKKVLLNFWASWCGPCVEEAPDLQKLYRSLNSPDSNTILVGIASDDSTEAVADFVKQNGLKYPVLLDNDGQIRAKYRVGGFPETFLINEQGKLTLILDPESGEPVIKLMGPRDWNSSGILNQLRK